MDTPASRERDGFRYDGEELASLGERFTLEPVDPATVRRRVEEGEQLVTMDIPDYLGRGVASDADTGIALYRLVQLFGTPNVPGLEAGADQPMRRRTTWQYLFRLTAAPADGGPEEAHLLSVYDHRTDLSVGLSEWHRPTDDPGRAALEPSAEPLPSGAIPDDWLLVAAVKLVLSTVEHAVRATYRDLHV